MTCNPATLRVLIPDLADPPDQLFTDNQLMQLISLYGGNAKRAAAAAIDAVATDQALLYKSVRTDDLAVDGTKVAEALRKRAQSLREEADRDDDASGEEAILIVPSVPDDLYFRPEASARPWGW